MDKVGIFLSSLPSRLVLITVLRYDSQLIPLDHMSPQSKLAAFTRTPREDDDKVIINLLYGSAQQVSAAPQDSARGS